MIVSVLLFLKQDVQATHRVLVMTSSSAGASLSPQMPRGSETLDPVLPVIGSSEAESKPPRAKTRLSGVQAFVWGCF